MALPGVLGGKAMKSKPLRWTPSEEADRDVCECGSLDCDHPRRRGFWRRVRDFLADFFGGDPSAFWPWPLDEICPWFKGPRR